MKEILNSENRDYAYDCLNKSLNIGIDFKLNNKFKEKNYEEQNFDDMLKIPYNSIELKLLLDKFKEEILPFCSNFSNEKFMGFPDAGNSIAGMSGAILADLLQ